MGARREHPPGRPAPEPPPPPKKADDGRRAQCVFELEIDLQREGLYDHPDPGAIQLAVEEAIEGAQFYAGPQRVPYRVTGVRVLAGQIATGSDPQ